MKTHAEQLSDVYMRASDLKAEADAIIEAAKAEGINVAILKKVAREMVTEPEKLAKKFEAEEQLDMFRVEVGLFKRKGLDETTKAETAFAAAGEKRLEKAARDLDAVAGTGLAASYADDKRKIRAWKARREASA